jgi:hypothetical protein
MALRTLDEQMDHLLAIVQPGATWGYEKPKKSYHPQPVVPPCLPSSALILKTYNKYRKGYDYTKEVWELRELMLPLAVAYYVNSQHFHKLYRYQTYRGNSSKANRYWEQISERFSDGCDGLLTGSDDILPTLQKAIQRLTQAKVDFDVLCAIDQVFNIMHDDGSIGKYMVTIHGKALIGATTNWENKFHMFIETLNTLRDW